jgi:hypothetical protein
MPNICVQQSVNPKLEWIEMRLISRFRQVLIMLLFGIIASSLCLTDSAVAWGSDPVPPYWCENEVNSAAYYKEYNPEYIYFTGRFTDYDSNKAESMAHDRARTRAIERINGISQASDCQYSVAGAGDGTEGMKVQVSMKCSSGYLSKGTYFGKTVASKIDKLNNDKHRACILLAVEKEQIKKMNRERDQFVGCTGIFRNAFNSITRSRETLRQDQLNYAAVISALQDLNSLRKSTVSCRNLQLAKGDFFPNHIEELERRIINNIEIVNNGPRVVYMQKLLEENKPPIELEVRVFYTNLNYKRIALSGFPLKIKDNQKELVSFLPYKLPPSDQEGFVRYRIPEYNPMYLVFISKKSNVNLLVEPHDLIKKTISDDAANLISDERLRVLITIRPPDLDCRVHWNSIHQSERKKDLESFMQRCSSDPHVEKHIIEKAKILLERLYYDDEKLKCDRVAEVVDADKHKPDKYESLKNQLEILGGELKHLGLKNLVDSKLRQLKKLKEKGFDESTYWNHIHFANLSIDQKIAEYGDFLGNFPKGSKNQDAQHEIEILVKDMPIYGLEKTRAKLVWIPPGIVPRNGKPVPIPNGFLMAEHETTVSEYGQFLIKFNQGNQPDDACIREEFSNWLNTSENEDQPVNCISYSDAKSFVQWLNKTRSIDSAQYRLCTDLEWEYAATIGDNGWPKLSEELDFHSVRHASKRIGIRGTDETMLSCYINERTGLYHMFGNVQEWVEITDSKGKDANCKLMVVGGSFMDPAKEIYPGNPSSCIKKDQRRVSNGFRFCRSLY